MNTARLSSPAGRPTSNVATRAVPSLEQHPIDLMRAEGVPTTVSTDARTCHDTTLEKELSLLTASHGWDRARHLEAQHDAAKAAFVSEQRRAELLTAIGG